MVHTYLDRNPQTGGAEIKTDPDTKAMDTNISERDRNILDELIGEKISTLRSITQINMPWRDAFESEIVRLRAKANTAHTEDDRRNLLAWATAHQFLLDELDTCNCGTGRDVSILDDDVVALVRSDNPALADSHEALRAERDALKKRVTDQDEWIDRVAAFSTEAATAADDAKGQLAEAVRLLRRFAAEASLYTDYRVRMETREFLARLDGES
jgi:hypothetical protein